MADNDFKQQVAKAERGSSGGTKQDDVVMKDGRPATFELHPGRPLNENTEVDIKGKKPVG